MKIVRSILFLCAALAVSATLSTSTLQAQNLYTPSGTVGTGTSGTNVGVGTNAPVALLQVDSGSFLCNGTPGTTPVSGSGTRMMWVPSKAAMRAGKVTGAAWDADSIGDYSAAFGNDTRALGDYSFAAGWDCRAAGDFSIAAGGTSSATGAVSVAIGDLASASGTNSHAYGNGAEAKELFSMAFGTNVKATKTSSIAVGSGVSSSSKMVNNKVNSFAVGFNSTVPTLFVGGGSGVGTIGKVGIGTKNPAATLDINGTGLVGGVAITSDRRYKQNITDVESGLEKVLALRGTTYEYNNEAGPRNNFREGRTYGFVAQEVMEVLPELVWEDADGYYAVNYDGVLPVLVEAIRELDARDQENEELRERLEALEETVKQLSAAAGTDGRPVMTPSDDAARASLGQNAPNPFGRETVIPVTIPELAGQAELVIVNMDGKEIHREVISGRGTQQLRVSGLKLARNGTYSYSLIIDGQLIDTQMMVVTP